MKYDIFVYMLQCADGSYYVGSYRGAELEWRVAEHNHGKYPTAYTYSRRPVRLVWSSYFTNAYDAVAFERRMKGWSRLKKEALIQRDEKSLKAFSRRGFRPSSILRDADLRSAPQDEDAFPGAPPRHPEEPRSGVTKHEGTAVSEARGE